MIARSIVLQPTSGIGCSHPTCRHSSLEFGLTPEGEVETEADLEDEFAFGAQAIAALSRARRARRRRKDARDRPFPTSAPHMKCGQFARETAASRNDGTPAESNANDPACGARLVLVACAVLLISFAGTVRGSAPTRPHAVPPPPPDTPAPPPRLAEPPPEPRFRADAGGRRPICPPPTRAVPASDSQPSPESPRSARFWFEAPRRAHASRHKKHRLRPPSASG